MPITGEPLVAGAQYVLTADGIGQIRFTECLKLGTKTEVVEHRIVGKDGQEVTRKIPGQQKALNVILKRRMDRDLSLANWRREVAAGKVDIARRNGTLVVYDANGTEIARWDFAGGWPATLVSSIPDGTEELTLAVDALLRR